jgi:uncharacterized membrane protein
MTETILGLGAPVLIRLCVAAFIVGGVIGLQKAMNDRREYVKSAIISGALMAALAIAVTGVLIAAEQFVRWFVAPFTR